MAEHGIVGKIATIIVILAFNLLCCFTLSNEDDAPIAAVAISVVYFTLGFTWVAIELLIEKGLI